MKILYLLPVTKVDCLPGNHIKQVVGYRLTEVMSHSRYDRATWHAFIKDTLAGCSLDESAEKLGFSHQTAFTMRHKVLTALLQSMEKGSEGLSGKGGKNGFKKISVYCIIKM